MSSNSRSSDAVELRITSMIITHKKARLEIIEKAWHGNVEEVLQKLHSFDSVHECFAIQTCNRVEVYTVGERNGDLLRKFADEMGVPERVVVIHNNEESLRHLLRLACGLESMIVGEDQILGQIREFYVLAKKAGTAGKVLSTALDKAIAVGKRARNETRINKGSVSIGSAAVDLAEEILGSLEDRKVMVIGAGEMATLVAKAVKARGLKAIFVANRTYERAELLAREVNGVAVKFEKIGEFIPGVDVLICATSAPHPIITEQLIKNFLEQHNGKRLLLIDIGNPRNIEEKTGELPGVELHNIDGLRAISERNLNLRMMEALKVEKIIEEELALLKDSYSKQKADHVISALYQRAEEIRKTEVEKACARMKNGNRSDFDERKIEIMEDLANAIVYKILAEPTKTLRYSAKNGEEDFINNVGRLFGLHSEG